jgi:Spy/CpxP family protein refolding chaperone
MAKTERTILIGLSASVALAWGYIELNTAAMHLGAHHHDARCQDHRHEGATPKVR